MGNRNFIIDMWEFDTEPQTGMRYWFEFNNLNDVLLIEKMHEEGDGSGIYDFAEEIEGEYGTLDFFGNDETIVGYDSCEITPDNYTIVAEKFYNYFKNDLKMDVSPLQSKSISENDFKIS